MAPLTVSISGPTQTYVGLLQVWRISAPGAILPADIGVLWGDGTPAESYSLTGTYRDVGHTYGSAGNYQIYVDVVDDGGNFGSDTHTVSITSSLSASLSADDTTPSAGQQITFSMSMSGGFPGYTWTLDAGDGSPIYGGSRSTAGTVSQTHTYMVGGQSYTATLTVEDTLGGATEMSLPIGVDVLADYTPVLIGLAAVAAALLIIWKVS